MFKYLAILFLAAGFSLPALSFTVTVTAIDAAEKPCPGLDGKITVKVSGVPTGENLVVVDIKCDADPSRGMDYNGGIDITNGAGVSDPIILRNHDINDGDNCTAYVGYRQGSEVETKFSVSYNQSRPPFKISSDGSNSATVGTQFAIHKLPRPYVGTGVPFKDLMLRECTASTDPWIFMHVPYKDDFPESDNLLIRTYPRLTTDNRGIKVQSGRINHDQCTDEYAYPGIVGNLVTVGDNYQGCKMKLLGREVLGGNTFNAQGAPSLANNAAVTKSSKKVMLHTGDKPSSPANIEQTIEVQISNDGGYSWRMSNKITSWTSAAADTGISTAVDNADNLAMIRITDGTDVWWRIIRGQ